MDSIPNHSFHLFMFVFVGNFNRGDEMFESFDVESSRPVAETGQGLFSGGSPTPRKYRHGQSILEMRGCRKLASAGNQRMRGTFGKVNVFLHSSLELQPKRSDHFLHKISCYTFLRADDKQAAEYGLGRMPTRSSCL